MSKRFSIAPTRSSKKAKTAPALFAFSFVALLGLSACGEETVLYEKVTLCVAPQLWNGSAFEVPQEGTLDVQVDYRVDGEIKHLVLDRLDWTLSSPSQACKTFLPQELRDPGSLDTSALVEFDLLPLQESTSLSAKYINSRPGAMPAEVTQWDVSVESEDVPGSADGLKIRIQTLQLKQKN